MSNSLWPYGPQHARLPYPSPTPEALSNSCPSSQWCHPTISSSVICFSSCLQSFPASGSSPMGVFSLYCLPNKLVLFAGTNGRWWCSTKSLQCTHLSAAESAGYSKCGLSLENHPCPNWCPELEGHMFLILGQLGAVTNRWEGTTAQPFCYKAGPNLCCSLCSRARAGILLKLVSK